MSFVGVSYVTIFRKKLSHWVLRGETIDVKLYFISTKRPRSSLKPVWKKTVLLRPDQHIYHENARCQKPYHNFFGSVSTIKVTVISSAQLQFFYSSHLVKRIHWVSCWCYVKQLIPAWVQDNQKFHDFSSRFGLFERYSSVQFA